MGANRAGGVRMLELVETEIPWGNPDRHDAGVGHVAGHHLSGARRTEAPIERRVKILAIGDSRVAGADERREPSTGDRDVLRMIVRPREVYGVEYGWLLQVVEHGD